MRLTVGRINFEDRRHWLYDTSMDMVHFSLRHGKFRTELSFGREILVDLEAIKNDKPDRNNTLMLHSEFRGIEDITLAGYVIRRDDRDNSSSPSI